MSVATILRSVLLLSLAGCSSASLHRTIRAEYNGNFFAVRGADPVDTHLFMATAGPELDISLGGSTLRIGAFIGPALFTDGMSAEAGLDVAPRLQWFLGEDTYLLAETDWTYYDDDGSQNVFVFLTLERRF